MWISLNLIEETTLHQDMKELIFTFQDEIVSYTKKFRL